MSIESQEYYRKVFLESEEWKTIRSFALVESGASCCICGAKSIHNDAHHVSYPWNIWKTKPTDLKILCRACHDFVHLISKLGKEAKANDEWILYDVIEAVQVWIGKLNGFDLLEQAHPAIASKKKRLGCRLCGKINPDTKLRNVLEYYQLPGKPPVLWNFCDLCFETVKQGVKWPTIPKNKSPETPAKIFTAIKRFIRNAS